MDILEYFENSKFWNDSLAVSLLASLSVLALVLIYLARLYHNIAKNKFPNAYVERSVKVKKDEPSAVIQALTDVVPVEEEESILMDHEYDGIRELDNNLPPWWKYGFYISIIWGVFYFVHYHVLELGDLSAEEYKKELIEAEQERKAYLAKVGTIINADNVAYQSDPVSLAKGQSLFLANCRTCHGENAQGDVGPNLVDAYWKHGGDISDRYKIIDQGKGTMPKWGDKLSPKDIQNIISYLKSIEGSNPPNAKEAEGELYEYEASEEGNESASK